MLRTFIVHKNHKLTNKSKSSSLIFLNMSHWTCNLSPKPSGGSRVRGPLAPKGQREDKKISVYVGLKDLPVDSMLLALVLLPNTESKSTLRPREFCGCWGVGEAVNPVKTKRKLTVCIQILTPQYLCSSQHNQKLVENYLEDSKYQPPFPI